MMLLAISHIRSFGGRPVLATDVVNFFLASGYKAHSAAGAVGAAIKMGFIRVVGTVIVGGKTVNLFV